MLGHPIPAASFHILEIMASPRYHLKHIGYLAAAQCFTQDTEVLILATNMIKKVREEEGKWGEEDLASLEKNR